MDLCNIAPLEESQIPSVVKVINDAYLLEATFKKDPTRITEDSFRELVLSGSGAHFVASITPESPLYLNFPSLPADGILGHIHVEYRPDYGYFGLLAVHPLLKGKGLGSLLLAFAEKSMLEKGLKQSGCQVVSPIPRLQTYYERQGYYTTGETEAWKSDNLKQEAWFIMMRKNLISSP